MILSCSYFKTGFFWLQDLLGYHCIFLSLIIPWNRLEGVGRVQVWTGSIRGGYSQAFRTLRRGFRANCNMELLLSASNFSPYTWNWLSLKPYLHVTPKLSCSPTNQIISAFLVINCSLQNFLLQTNQLCNHFINFLKQ